MTGRALAEIDAVHIRLREAFRRRDLPTYMESFTPDLTYRQPDGSVLSRDDLARSIRRQLARLVAFDSRFQREASTLAGSDLTETGTQTAEIALRVFAIFAIRWRIERRGRYTWTLTEAGWKLRDAWVERETISRTGFGLASRIDAR